MTLRSLESQTMEGFNTDYSVKSQSLISNYNTDTKNIKREFGKLLLNRALDDTK